MQRYQKMFETFESDMGDKEYFVFLRGKLFSDKLSRNQAEKLKNSLVNHQFIRANKDEVEIK